MVNISSNANYFGGFLSNHVFIHYNSGSLNIWEILEFHNYSMWELIIYQLKYNFCGKYLRFSFLLAIM